MVFRLFRIAQLVRTLENGQNVCMCAGSSIIGNSIIGDNVMVGANTIIKDEVVPSNVIVFGESPNLIIKKKKNLEPFYW